MLAQRTCCLASGRFLHPWFSGRPDVQAMADRHEILPGTTRTEMDAAIDSILKPRLALEAELLQVLATSPDPERWAAITSARRLAVAIPKFAESAAPLRRFPGMTWDRAAQIFTGPIPRAIRPWFVNDRLSMWRFLDEWPDTVLAHLHAEVERRSGGTPAPLPAIPWHRIPMGGADERRTRSPDFASTRPKGGKGRKKKKPRSSVHLDFGRIFHYVVGNHPTFGGSSTFSEELQFCGWGNSVFGGFLHQFCGI